MSDISEIILRNLQYNEDFIRKASPFLKEEYFESGEEKTYYKSIDTYFTTYNKRPSKEALQIDFQNMKVQQDLFESLVKMSEKMEAEKDLPVDPKWLIDKTEAFCQDRSLY